MRAMNDYVILDEIKEPVKTAGGLEMSSKDMRSQRYIKGKVLALPPDAPKDHIKVGDIVHVDASGTFGHVMDEQTVTITKLKFLVGMED